MRNSASLFVLFVLVLLQPHMATAQTSEFSASREQVADLKGSWHFHLGDPQDGSMSWSSPGFDDASWQLLPFDHSWDVPGYRQSGGDCWYRIKLRVPPDHPPLALLIPAIYSSYQVFANGRLVGQIVAANAGHIAPYVGGREMSMESSLPLGLAGDASYPETVSVLAPGIQITLLTDGVVEAQDPAGKLFGFDRTAAISTHSADQIAQAAQFFGQEDDITVLTMQRIVTA